MRTHTYAVTVEPDYAAGGAEWIVTVNGTRHRYPLHWEDLPTHIARRAVAENYRVDSVSAVVDNRHRGEAPGRSFLVRARVF